MKGRVVDNRGRLQRFRGFLGEMTDSGFGYSWASGKDEGERDMRGRRDWISLHSLKVGSNNRGGAD